MVYMYDWGSYAVRLGGSSPLLSKKLDKRWKIKDKSKKVTIRDILSDNFKNYGNYRKSCCLE